MAGQSMRKTTSEARIETEKMHLAILNMRYFQSKLQKCKTGTLKVKDGSWYNAVYQLLRLLLVAADN